MQIGTQKVIPAPDFRISPDGRKHSKHWETRSSLATGIGGWGISFWLLGRCCSRGENYTGLRFRRKPPSEISIWLKIREIWYSYAHTTQERNSSIEFEIKLHGCFIVVSSPVRGRGRRWWSLALVMYPWRSSETVKDICWTLTSWNTVREMSVTSHNVEEVSKSLGCDIHTHAHAQESLQNMFLEQMGTERSS